MPLRHKSQQEGTGKVFVSISLQPLEFLVDAGASLWKTTLPLRTARTEQSFGNFLAQYLATEVDDRMVCCLDAAPTISLLAA